MVRRLPGALSAAAVAALVLLLIRQRVDQHLVNVDDYLYSRQTDVFWEALTSGRIGIVDAWKLFGVNSPLVPTLAGPISAVDGSPSALVLVELPLAVALLVALAALLRRVGVENRWAAAVAIVALPPVLTYTAMLSFAIAATTCVVAALVAYGASDRLRNRGAAAWLGVALGLLSLSRVVALVYLAALLVPIVVDLLLDRDDVKPRVQHGALTAAIAAAIAAPWWLTAGPKAVHYLVDAGYGSGVFTSNTSVPRRELDRLMRTADETGWLLAIALLVLFVGGMALAARRRDRTTLLVAATVLLGFVLLGTSSNAGTAFALPFEVLAAVTAATALRGRARAAVASVAVAVAAAGVFSSGVPTRWHQHALWLSGIPAREQLQGALGCTCPLPDTLALNQQVYALIGTSPTLVLRDDAIVNPESLRYLGQQHHGEPQLSAPPGATVDPALLDAATFVLAGSTAAPYLGVDLARAESQLPQAGYRKVFERRLSPASAVELWSR